MENNICQVITKVWEMLTEIVTFLAQKSLINILSYLQSAYWYMNYIFTNLENSKITAKKYY